MSKYLSTQKETTCFEVTCQKKIRFRTSHKALNALRNNKRYITCSNLRIYKCKFCRGWHIGHKTED